MSTTSKAINLNHILIFIQRGRGGINKKIDFGMWNTFCGRHPGATKKRWRILFMWRRSSFTPRPSQIAELFTLSPRQCPATLQRKLISAACNWDLLGHHPDFMSIGDGGKVDQPVNEDLCMLTKLSLFITRDHSSVCIIKVPTPISSPIFH